MTLPIARELAKLGTYTLDLLYCCFLRLFPRLSGIRVNTIAPGVFYTPMLEGLPPKVMVRVQQSTVAMCFS